MTVATRTPAGPTVRRECGFCEGQGYINPADGVRIACKNCNGSGGVDVNVKPFVMLEGAMEHLQAIRTCMGLRRTEDFKPRAGTPAYHVDAAEDYIARLFQQLVVMLPDEYERTEG